MNVGACKAGIKTCLQDGSAFGPCVGLVVPSAELCDGIDNDCNGAVDDNAVDVKTWYHDADGDGFGDPNSSILSCETSTGYVANNLDCNDQNRFIHPMKINDPLPGGVEICDGLDNDCDGQVDNNCVNAACSVADMDLLIQCAPCIVFPGTPGCQSCSYGISPACQSAATDLMNAGYLPPNDIECRNNGSCTAQWIAAFGPVPPECVNDQTKICGSNVGECKQGTQTCSNGKWGACAGSVGPVPEICDDGKDNDCNGQTDENKQDFWRDADGDGFGNPNDSIQSCAQPVGYVMPMEQDCDDNNPDINRPAIWWYDGDGDGYGQAGNSMESCMQPAGYVPAFGQEDCNDENASVHPGGTEICNWLDDDCNGIIDDGFNVQSDINNCGTCGNVCNLPNATPLCQGGVCQIASCSPGLSDCDGSAANGCETDVSVDSNNCGGCNHACNSEACLINAVCSNGVCTGQPMCDDGIACTTDTCTAIGPGACSYSPNDSACNDGNLCTTDFCDGFLGCQFVPVSEGVSCGTNLTCQGGVCKPV